MRVRVRLINIHTYKHTLTAFRFGCAGIFDDRWVSAIDSISRATVRGEYTHGEATALREDEDSVALPLVCCGDSLRNIGLGGGGNLAIQDALDLCAVLQAPDAFDSSTGHIQPSTLEKLRAVEAAALERKQKHFASQQGAAFLFERDPNIDPVCRSFADFADKPLSKFVLSVGQPLYTLFYKFHLWRSGGQLKLNDETTPLSKHVMKVLEEEEKAASTHSHEQKD